MRTTSLYAPFLRPFFTVILPFFATDIFLLPAYLAYDTAPTALLTTKAFFAGIAHGHVSVTIYALYPARPLEKFGG